MKKNFISAIFLMGISASAQVGINTAEPKASLHVDGKTSDGSRPEGVIIPKLTGNALFAASQLTTPA